MALAAVRLTGEPSRVAPSRNCTLPVAVLGVTVAVKVTVCPSVEGSADEVTVTVELETISFSVAEVLPALLSSPLYTAVMG